MTDYGQKAADRAFSDVRRRLLSNYRQSAREVEQKLEKTLERFRKEEAEKRIQLKKGAITEEQYQDWLRRKVFKSEQWTRREKELARTLARADEVAADIVNGKTRDVFMENANFTGYSVERDIGNIAFEHYDENTVARILKEQPNLLPPRRIKQKEDVEWYHQIINNSIVQGIVQGKSIPEIAKTIQEDSTRKAKIAALRNARTAMTSAQNAGRIEGLHQAQALGVNVKKRWLATLDGRTRDAHRDLDGQVKDVDEPFVCDQGEILFPGDPAANPALVYNCRCTLTYVYPDYQMNMQRRDNVTGEVIEDITYRDWERSKGILVNNAVGGTADKADNQVVSWEEKKKTYSYLFDVNGLDKWEIIDTFEQYCTPLTEEDKETQSFYIRTPNSFSVNSLLRENPDDPLESLFDKDDLISLRKFDKLIEKDSLKENTILTRLVDDSYTENVLNLNNSALRQVIQNFDDKNVQDGLNSLIGTEVLERGYMSTAGVKGPSAFGHRNVELRLYAEKGTHALITNPIEVEVALGRNTAYRIAGFDMDRDNNRLVVECEILKKGKK